MEIRSMYYFGAFFYEKELFKNLVFNAIDRWPVNIYSCWNQSQNKTLLLRTISFRTKDIGPKIRASSSLLALGMGVSWTVWKCELESHVNSASSMLTCWLRMHNWQCFFNFSNDCIWSSNSPFSIELFLSFPK